MDAWRDRPEELRKLSKLGTLPIRNLLSAFLAFLQYILRRL